METGMTDAVVGLIQITNQDRAAAEAFLGPGAYTCSDSNIVLQHLAGLRIQYEKDGATKAKIAVIRNNKALFDAVQTLRQECNIQIKQINNGRGNCTPGFENINLLLLKCDAVFREMPV